jgi:hypothetical protein
VRAEGLAPQQIFDQRNVIASTEALKMPLEATELRSRHFVLLHGGSNPGRCRASAAKQGIE